MKKEQPPPIDPTLAQNPAWRKIMEFYRTLKPGLRLMQLPLIGPVLQKALIPADSDANWFIPQQAIIPVGEVIPVGAQTVLPAQIIEQLLQQADGIFAMAACPCRSAFECQNHPRNIGCLHLGSATYNIPRELGRQLTLEEGIEYLDRALSEGLTPTILHIPSEAEIFQVEKTRMLSICLCCECCCDVRLMLRQGPNRYWDQYNHRLPGLQVVVDENCTRCGACVTACYGGERVISIGPEKAEIHERCIGCGRCIPTCPVGAIALVFDPQVDSMAALLERISRRVRISA